MATSLTNNALTLNNYVLTGTKSGEVIVKPSRTDYGTVSGAKTAPSLAVGQMWFWYATKIENGGVIRVPASGTYLVISTSSNASHLPNGNSTIRYGAYIAGYQLSGGNIIVYSSASDQDYYGGGTATLLMRRYQHEAYLRRIKIRRMSSSTSRSLLQRWEYRNWYKLSNRKCNTIWSYITSISSSINRCMEWICSFNQWWTSIVHRISFTECNRFKSIISLDSFTTESELINKEVA